ncbi:MAG: O-methyltransferase, partial [Acidobacteria bacterium]|nr:O-methyltransferase [Acidobacteriota bacterium]
MIRPIHFFVFAASVWLAVAAQKIGLPREQVLQHLAGMRAAERGMMNVAPAEGEYLENLARKVKARRVLEIGTSNGYSGIWLALGLRETGGRLITLDVDEPRWKLAQKNFAATGLASIIDSRLTDALKELPKLKGPFDLVFIDAWKPDYIRYLQMTLPLVPSGGVITAHNVHSHPQDMQDFLQAIKTDPSLKTEFVSVGPS